MNNSEKLPAEYKSQDVYVRPAVRDLGAWSAVTLQMSVPVIPIGPGANSGPFWEKATKNW